MTRSCARRSLAAETIFMALVICCVFLTERMRRRMSIRLGMGGSRWQFGDETCLELLDNRYDLRAQCVVERLLGADLLENRAMGVIHKAIQLFLELPARFHREVVEIALRAREDDENLFFERQ